MTTPLDEAWLVLKQESVEDYAPKSTAQAYTPEYTAQGPVQGEVRRLSEYKPYFAPETDPWVRNIDPQTLFLINRQHRETQRAIAQEQRRKREDEKALDDLRRRMTEPRTGPASMNA